MSIFNTPLGMGIRDNPIKESPFVINADIIDFPLPGGAFELSTEAGDPILTEGGEFITTE